jgi:molybdate transport system permease protein
VIPDDLSPLWISLGASSAATVLAFVFGVVAAHAVYRYNGRGRGIIDGVLTLPLVLPPTVVGFFLLLVFGRRSAIGELLEHVGIRIAFSWPATVIAATVVAFPLMYRATLGGFEQVNPNLLGAARTLGAGEWRTFSRVLLPLARPAVIAGVVLTFARALGEFGATLMLAGNIPGRTQTIPVAIFFAADGGDMRRALAWVILIVFLSLVTIAALNYWAPRGKARTTRTAMSARSPEILPQPRMLAGGASSEPTIGADRGGLHVEVHKRYPNFVLTAAFSGRNGSLGLLGASGYGKSMTLRCIAGLEKPESGRITLNGRVLLDTASHVNTPPAQRRIGVVFQDYALFPHLTVRENIAFGLDRLPSEKQSERTMYWSRMMQIDPLLDAYPGELSGGQRQRVALARALAMEPEALLLDEPLSALDPHLRRQMEEHLRVALEHYRGVTIFVTHDRDEAFRSCEDLVVLSDGKVVAGGPKRAIFAHPRVLAVARLTGCKNIAGITRTGPRQIRTEDWGCTLTVDSEPPAEMAYVGIRAHDIRVVTQAGSENTFPCWLVASIESPFETTLYLRLHSRPNEGDCAHLEAEVPRSEWANLASALQPWYVVLDSSALLFLEP